MKFVTKIIVILLIFTAFQTAKAEWTKQNVNTFAWLKTVHFVDAKTGWIGGSRGTFLKTTDGGESWKQTKKFTDDTIREIVFLDKKTGWLLCERDVFSLGKKEPTYLLKTTNGGEIWQRVDFNNDRRQRITKVFFAKSGFGLAIGETGALFGLKDDNENWLQMAPPSDYLLLDGAFTSDLRGTIVGGGGTILFTEDAGASWNKAYIANDAKSKLNSVFFINEKNGWTVGSKGMIYQTGNGGKLWNLQKSNIDKDLNDVYFANSAEGWAVGDNGTILHTTTAGNIWQKEEVRLKHKLEKIFFAGERGWIVGFGGTIMSYEKNRRNDSKRPKFNDR